MLLPSTSMNGGPSATSQKIGAKLTELTSNKRLHRACRLEGPLTSPRLPVLMGLAEWVQELPELHRERWKPNPWRVMRDFFFAMFLENLFPPIPSETDHVPLGGLLRATKASWP